MTFLGFTLLFSALLYLEFNRFARQGDAAFWRLIYRYVLILALAFFAFNAGLHFIREGAKATIVPEIAGSAGI